MEHIIQRGKDIEMSHRADDVERKASHRNEDENFEAWSKKRSAEVEDEKEFKLEEESRAWKQTLSSMAKRHEQEIEALRAKHADEVRVGFKKYQVTCTKIHEMFRHQEEDIDREVTLRRDSILQDRHQCELEVHSMRAIQDRDLEAEVLKLFRQVIQKHADGTIIVSNEQKISGEIPSRKRAFDDMDLWPIGNTAGSAKKVRRLLITIKFHPLKLREITARGSPNGIRNVPALEKASLKEYTTRSSTSTDSSSSTLRHEPRYSTPDHNSTKRFPERKRSYSPILITSSSPSPTLGMKEDIEGDRGRGSRLKTGRRVGGTDR
ncbi:hypothetical protein G7Y89_g7086 [Cudoniella acicularis]|uniref:Uncharacterized protein n=1 Tax=Cudoniella acicularis TaxID=354080 RepID=A0A8H4RL36_9HELO|nr:hypothetical protein G7Y89_g7086 [Cudoniella acicularis]